MTRRLEVVRERSTAVIDHGVEAELVHKERGLGGTAGDADDTASVDAGELPDDIASRTRSTGYQDSLALPRSAEHREPDVGGDSGDAEHPEVVAQGASHFHDPHRSRVKLGVFLPADGSGDDRPDRYLTVAGDHFGQPVTRHHRALDELLPVSSGLHPSP